MNFQDLFPNWLKSIRHVKSDIGHAPFSYNQRASDAYKLIKHLGLKKVTVLGFSDGGRSAYKLAALYPGVISKMVVMGAGDRPDKRKEPLHYSTENLMNGNKSFFEKKVANMPEPNRWDESLKMLNKMYNFDIVSGETFRKIKCPVLLISGENDKTNGLESIKKVDEYLTDSRYKMISGCGHVILFCNFQAVWDAINGFLD